MKLACFVVYLAGKCNVSNMGMNSMGIKNSNVSNMGMNSMGIKNRNFKYISL